MGARFSVMRNGDRELLAREVYSLLRESLGDIGYPRTQYPRTLGNRDLTIYWAVFTSGFGYDNELFNQETLDLQGVRDVEVCLAKAEDFISLFGAEIFEQIKSSVLPLWMTYLLNNIHTDEDATSERVENCRLMLSREIVRRVCEGEIAVAQE